MRFETGAIPPQGNAARVQRYRATEKGQKALQRGYDLRTQRRESEYLTRPFVAWDGEGITELDGSHTYFLLANSRGDSLVRREGLSTQECLDLLHTYSDSDAINVVFGGTYDINMMLRDIDEEALEDLLDGVYVTRFGYRIHWRAGKYLRLTRNKQTVTLWDVLPFFQTSFVNACDEYLGDSWLDRDGIIAGKAARGTFDTDSIDDVVRYNKSELVNLVRLCTELRERLYKVEIRLSRWDGPGAIAKQLLKKHGVKASMSTVPDKVAEAARYAYAGGRFEMIRQGHSEQPAWQYDIRSAYPSAMRNLPCLAHGTWERIDYPQTVAPFGVYMVRNWNYDAQLSRPQPGWTRAPNGSISYPDYTLNWYWSPEAGLLRECGAYLMRGWVYHTECTCDPFDFVEPLYNKRAALKKAKDGAHVGLKLGLNSLYGSLAQQVGWRIDKDGNLRTPPYHQLEWAGYVTSHCRAQVFRAAMTAPDHIIAFETDAVFSRRPLPLKIGTRLGEWDVTEYQSLTYWQSGFYFGTTTDGREVRKTRGIDKDSVTRQQFVDAFTSTKEQVIIPARDTRFIGAGLALTQGMDKWRRWVTADRDLSKHVWTKRIGVYDKKDLSAEYCDDGWEETVPAGSPSKTFLSSPYPVDWINPDDEMSDLREFREDREDEWEEWYE